MAFSLSNINFKSPWVWGIVLVGGGGLAFLIYKMRQNQPGSQGAASGPNESAAQQASETGGANVFVVDETTTNTEDEDEDNDGAPEGKKKPGPVYQPPPSPGPRNWFGPPPGLVHQPPPSPGGRYPPPGRGGHLPPPSPGERGGRRYPPPQPPIPPSPPKRFVHPAAWPRRDSTLSQIARDHGTSVTRLTQFPENAYILDRPGGINRIFTSDTIRVA